MAQHRLRRVTVSFWCCCLFAFSATHATFEDFYGPTGDRFRGAISLINFQAETGDTNPAAQSFGLAIDDMEVEWEEFVLVDDAAECDGGGSCAVVSLAQTNFFTGSTIVDVTVLDPSPYGEDGVNDCDGNGSFLDALDTTDCDENGTDDVIVVVSSPAEIDGERIACNRIGSSLEYRGSIATTTFLDQPGVLFLGPSGGELPSLTATYLDIWDGRGIDLCDGNSDNPGAGCTDDLQCPNGACVLSPCQNDVDPARWGLVEVSTTVAVSACEVTVSGANFVDNGDGDKFGDTNETLDIDLEFNNACTGDLTNCIARLASNSPEVDCITDGIIDLGDLPEGTTTASASLVDGFSIKVADVSRTSIFEDLTADFTVTLSCDQIDTTSVLQEFSITLDMDVTASGPSIPWVESFESANPATPGDFASFVADNLDAGIPPGPGESDADALARADGMRCQYSDPDAVDSNVYATNSADKCYPGHNPSHASTHWWEIHGAGDSCSADTGRAYDGTQSLYFGSCLDETLGYTTPTGQLEGVKSSQPINLGVGSPTLTFKHQVSLMRSPAQGGAISAPSGTTADRAVVSLRIAGDFCAGGSNDGNPCDILLGNGDCPGGTCDQNLAAGPWIKLNPFQNAYAMTNYDFYNSCMFDPIDDGNTEDDYFDPANPTDALGLLHGPSSTCDPELIWAGIGDTDDPFSVNNVQNGDPGSGLQGSLFHDSSGTWVESAFDLSEHRGRRIWLRFLTTGLKGTLETWEAQFNPLNPNPADDGWWIDDLLIDDTLAAPALFSIDTNPNLVVSQGGTFPECGIACGSVTALSETDPSPATLPAPGQPLEIDAAPSFADQCHSGTLQYRFSTAAGQELRDWTDNPVILVAPGSTTDYVVEARCSSLTNCAGSTVVTATVNCPPPVATQNAFGETMFPEGNKQEFSWASTRHYSAFSGAMSMVGTYTGAFVSSGEGVSFVDASRPAANSGYYYVVRGGEYCNDAGLWTSGGPGENPSRETLLP